MHSGREVEYFARFFSSNMRLTACLRPNPVERQAFLFRWHWWAISPRASATIRRCALHTVVCIRRLSGAAVRSFPHRCGPNAVSDAG